jgi:hypothetical protein
VLAKSHLKSRLKRFFNTPGNLWLLKRVISELADGETRLEPIKAAAIAGDVAFA